MSTIQIESFGVQSRFSAREALQCINSGCVTFGHNDVRYYDQDAIDTFRTRIVEHPQQHISIGANSVTLPPSYSYIVTTSSRDLPYCLSKVIFDVPGTEVTAISNNNQPCTWRMRDSYLITGTLGNSYNFNSRVAVKMFTRKTAAKYIKQCEDFYGVPFDFVVPTLLRLNRDETFVKPDMKSDVFMSMVTHNVQEAKNIEVFYNSCLQK